MRDLLDRFRSLPLPVTVVVLFVLFFGIRVLLEALPGFGERLDTTTVIGDLFSAAVLTTVFSIVIARARRRAGGASELASIGRTIRRGDVPADADPVAWRSTLEQVRRQHARQRWLGPIVCGLFLPLGGWILVEGDSPALGVVCIVVFGGFLVYSVIDTPRKLRRIDTLLAQLDGRTWQPPTAGHRSGDTHQPLPLA